MRLVRTSVFVLGVREGIEHGDGSWQHLQADEQVLYVAAVLSCAQGASAHQNGNQNTLQLITIYSSTLVAGLVRGLTIVTTISSTESKTC